MKTTYRKRLLCLVMDTGYIPVTIFVDGNGKVVDEVYVGSRSYSAWASVIEANLG